MSLPIYTKPLEKDIIEELEHQKFNKEDINEIVSDFSGRKREEELLGFLIKNRYKNISLQDIIAKKLEIKNMYDKWWGYIIDKDGDEIYKPEIYTKNSVFNRRNYNSN